MSFIIMLHFLPVTPKDKEQGTHMNTGDTLKLWGMFDLIVIGTSSSSREACLISLLLDRCRRRRRCRRRHPKLPSTCDVS